MELFGATFDKTPKNNKGNSSSQQPDFSGTCFAEGYPLICSKKYGLEDLLETFSDIFASYCGADQWNLSYTGESGYSIQASKYFAWCFKSTSPSVVSKKHIWHHQHHPYSCFLKFQLVCKYCHCITRDRCFKCIQREQNLGQRESLWKNYLSVEQLIARLSQRGCLGLRKDIFSEASMPWYVLLKCCWSH